ncbi:MAG: EVE domain-containing protein [Proteobacteria bacterium]|nr:EVE domain-containing protein [Pseudomonadota bacterium]
MQYWLLKSEPEEYSWDDLVRQGRGVWDGVRNPQAANYMRQMRLKDLAYFYHTGKEKAIVGVMEVVRTAFPDPTDSAARFVAIEVLPLQKLANPVSLSVMRQDSALAGLLILRQPRLSVAPVSTKQWQRILQLSCL